jgi:nicotinamidase/pyrazinamidase
MARYGPDVALIVVDMQNDFADPGGSLSVAEAESIIPTINAQIELAREAGAPVVYTRDWHPESTPHFAKDGGIWPVHCVAGTWGAEFHPDLVVDGPEIRKGANGEDGYSGFTMRDPVSGETTSTGLDAWLDSVRRLVVVGLATDYCVKATAIDGLTLGYEVTLLKDAIRAVNLEDGDGDRALREVLDASGVVE